jgi:hypothetical protein
VGGVLVDEVFEGGVIVEDGFVGGGDRGWTRHSDSMLDERELLFVVMGIGQRGRRRIGTGNVGGTKRAAHGTLPMGFWK